MPNISSVSFILFSSLYVYSQATAACNELGPHEFNVPKSLETSCAKVAEKIALVMASTMPKIKKKIISEFPGGKITTESTTLYSTKKDSNHQNVIGYNVILNTQNHWQCNYCIDMALDSKNRCYVINASRILCAK
jgi:hypothetical protein